MVLRKVMKPCVTPFFLITYSVLNNILPAMVLFYHNGVIMIESAPFLLYKNFTLKIIFIRGKMYGFGSQNNT